MANKKKKSLPKARHIWRINPKTRVTPSKKKYRRAEEKKQLKLGGEEVD